MKKLFEEFFVLLIQCDLVPFDRVIFDICLLSHLKLLIIMNICKELAEKTFNHLHFYASQLSKTLSCPIINKKINKV